MKRWLEGLRIRLAWRCAWAVQWLIPPDDCGHCFEIADSLAGHIKDHLLARRIWIR